MVHRKCALPVRSAGRVVLFAKVLVIINQTFVQHCEGGGHAMPHVLRPRETTFFFLRFGIDSVPELEDTVKLVESS